MNPENPPIVFYGLLRYQRGRDYLHLTTCSACWALVEEGYQERHLLWHREMTDDLITGLSAAVATSRKDAS